MQDARVKTPTETHFIYLDKNYISSPFKTRCKITFFFHKILSISLFRVFLLQ